MLYLVVALFLVAVIVVPVYLTGNPTAAAIATAQVDATPAPTPAPVRSWAAPPTMAVKDTVKYTAVIQTSKGLIRAELAAADAPQLVNNFLFLTNQGFYSTGQKLNQVSANTRVDMGALNPDGTGGPGYSMDLPEARQPVPIGSLTFVADPSGKAGSRFAVTLATQPPGPVNLGVFGRVTDGLDIARQLTPEDTLIRVSVNTQNLTPLPPAAAPSPAPSVSPQAP
ncbi:MAG: hypothetical protein EXR51_09525 [Dehalococcoidia bacterium]|nr:hypothetical protein [Dehalococcoidia bacterium]